MKLKLYSGSKEKFDEVLVYGFPATEEQSEMRPITPKPTRPPPNMRAKMVAISDYQKALKFDSLAFLDDTDDDDEYDYDDDDSDDEGEIDDNDQNDDEQVEYCYDIPTCKSRGSKSEISLNYDTTPMDGSPLSTPFSSGRFFGLDRDSTLRITLTRPEVRIVNVQDPVNADDTTNNLDDDDKSRARPRPADLLALEPLEILPDHTAFATLSKQTTKSSLASNKDNVMKNMLTKMKPKAHSPWLCV